MPPSPRPPPGHARPHPRRCAAALAALLAAPAAWPAIAAPDTYAIDPVHTRIAVAVDHAGFSKAIGTVSGTTGTLVFDPDDWSTASVTVEIPITRIDFGDGAWNSATLARGLLDGERHPVARFASTRVEALGDGRARVHGLLTLRGVAREVVLDATLNALKRHPMPPFRRTAGFSATATLSRRDFGSDAWASMIGDAVEIRIEAEATRSRGGDAVHPADDAPEPPAPDAVEPDATPAESPTPTPSEPTP